MGHQKASAGLADKGDDLPGSDLQVDSREHLPCHQHAPCYKMLPENVREKSTEKCQFGYIGIAASAKALPAPTCAPCRIW